MSRDGDTRTFSAEVSRRIGDELRWFDARINLLEDELGSPLGYLCVLRDVTERKAAEHQLLLAKKRVEELSRLKSAFLSNMSHEIRTPLAGIIGLSDMLYEETEGEHQEFAGLIRDGGARLLRMLNSVLSVAHLSSGKIEQHARRVDIVELIRSTMDGFRVEAERAGLELTFAEPAAPVDAVLDPDHFSHAIGHLLDNAIHFTESGRVNVRLESTSDDIHVMISDTGRGMDARFLEQAAEAFSQEAFDLDRPVEGSGLGLRVAYGLVEEMNGQISVDSAQGAGTCFTVTVPRRAAIATHAPDPDLQAVTSA
jgi:signal transduction histidine kinase